MDASIPNTPGQMLALHVTPAKAADRAAVATLADAVQAATAWTSLPSVRLEATPGQARPSSQLAEGHAAAAQMGCRACLRGAADFAAFRTRL